MAVSRNQRALVSEPELEDWDDLYLGDRTSRSSKTVGEGKEAGICDLLPNTVV